LTKRELAHRLMEQLVNFQQIDERFGGRPKLCFRHTVNSAKQLEAVDDRKVPPQLCALAKDNADASNVKDAFIPGNDSIDFAMAR